MGRERKSRFFESWMWQATKSDQREHRKNQRLSFFFEEKIISFRCSFAHTYCFSFSLFQSSTLFFLGDVKQFLSLACSYFARINYQVTKTCCRDSTGKEGVEEENSTISCCCMTHTHTKPRREMRKSKEWRWFVVDMDTPNRIDYANDDNDNYVKW